MQPFVLLTPLLRELLLFGTPSHFLTHPYQGFLPCVYFSQLIRAAFLLRKNPRLVHIKEARINLNRNKITANQLINMAGSCLCSFSYAFDNLPAKLLRSCLAALPQHRKRSHLLFNKFFDVDKYLFHVSNDTLQSLERSTNTEVVEFVINGDWYTGMVHI